MDPSVDYDEEEDPNPSSATPTPAPRSTSIQPRGFRPNSNIVSIPTLPRLPNSTSHSRPPSSAPHSQMFPSLGQSLAFWQGQLKDRPVALPMLPFATQGFRNPDSAPSYHRFEISLSTTMSMNLRFACINLSQSEMHFGLAALQVLLMHLTGAEDFVIGIGRTMGNRSDVMPVRFKASLGESLEQLLVRTQDTLRSTGQYLHVTVKSLLSALDLSRQTLLHQVTYDWLSSSLQSSHNMDTYFQHSQDLVVVVREDAQGDLRVLVAMQENIYENEHAQLIAELYVQLLSSLGTELQEEVCNIDILNPSIREKSEELGTGTQVKPFAESILMQISDVTEMVPDRVAVEDQYGNRVSYIRLVKQAVAISTVLRANGVTKATPVCVLGSPTIDLLCSMLAIWCAGGIYVPIDHHESVEHNTTLVGHCGTNICIVSAPDLVQYSQSIGLSVTLNCSALQFVGGVETVDEAMPEDVAVALHADASNGSVKGIMLTHGNLLSMITAAKYYFKADSPVVLQHTNWIHDFSLFQILYTLTSGGTLILAPSPEDPAEIPKLLSQQKVTVTIATPSEYSAWFRSNPDALQKCPSWKLAFCGGENLTSSIIRDFAALGNSDLELINMYGRIETSVACCMGVANYREYVADTEGKLIPVGSVLPNNSVWIADQFGHPIPPGWTGEIYVGGSGISTGYFGPDVDDGLFCINDESGARSFRTGDVGFMNEHGVLFVVSREQEKSVVQLRGYLIDLNDIARTIIDKPNGKVADAVVVLNKEEEPQVQAFVVFSEAPTTGSPRYLQAMLRGLNLPNFMRPTRAVILEAFPHTSAGRTDRRALHTMSLPDAQIIQIVQPASSFGRSQHPLRGNLLGSTEQKILEIWKGILPRTAVTSTITATTDFFALGGTTSLLSQVLHKMRLAFRETLTLTDLAHNPTLRGMTTVAMNKFSIFTLGGAGIDWKSETALPMTGRSDQSTEALKIGQGMVILLTGATGFLGLSILECLVNAPQVALVHCVAVHSPAKIVSHPKVIYHSGDLTQRYIGLSDSDWTQLSRSVDVIIHAAALVDHIRPYSSLRTTNVLPTKKLIQFAAPRLIPIHFVSSAGVGRFVGHPTFPEMAVAGYPPPEYTDGYTASKWASEVVLEKAHSKLGIPIMIHRPTTIIGRNASPNDVLTNLFGYAKELHAVPDLKPMKDSFDVIPLDVVARTIVREALEPIKGINFSNIGGVKRVPVRDLHLAIAMDTGIDMKKVHLQEWVRMAKDAGMSSEVAHEFEEFDELVKVFVYPEVKRSRDLA